MDEDLFGQPISPPKANGYTPDFERLWAIHRQGRKPDAFRAFNKAVPAKIDLETCVAALTKYAVYVHGQRGWNGAHLSTWLNGEQWEEHVDSPSDDGAARAALDWLS